MRDCEPPIRDALNRSESIEANLERDFRWRPDVNVGLPAPGLGSREFAGDLADPGFEASKVRVRMACERLHRHQESEAARRGNRRIKLSRPLQERLIPSRQFDLAWEALMAGVLERDRVSGGDGDPIDGMVGRRSIVLREAQIA